MTQLSIPVFLFMFVTTVYARKCYFRPNETEVCPFSVEILDFFREDNATHNTSDVEWLNLVHRNYPCEFMKFWAEGSFKSFVDALRFIYKYILPLEIAVGVALNIFALIMIRSKQGNLQKKKREQSAVYLMGWYQCWSDIGALLITCTMGYVRSYDSAFEHLVMSNIALCRAFKILTSFFEFSSPWLNVIIALNRLYDIKRPLRRRNIMTRKRVHCTMTGLFTMAFAFAATKIYFSGFEEYSAFEYRSCETRGRTDFAVATVYVALSTYLPSIVLIISNIELANVIKERSDALFGKLLLDSRHIRRRTAQNKRIILVIASVSVFYSVVQIPLGLLEMTELYWNLIRRKQFCRSDRRDFAQWRIKKMVLKWVRALFYLINQLGFIINFSCLLWTSADFQKIKNGFRQFAASIKLNLEDSSSVNRNSVSEPSTDTSVTVQPQFINRQ